MALFHGFENGKKTIKNGVLNANVCAVCKVVLTAMRKFYLLRDSGNLLLSA